ncbi:hypothetical protein [Nitrosomonas sp. ANs5]|uniref:hypothetical protein n=1 Tax=Nitrosomonas sp. ANs5 TaxID=3423941 RepID=UPI003D34430F
MIKNYLLLLLGLTFFILLTGCMHTPPKALAESEILAKQQVSQDDLNELMHYYHLLRQKSALELAWEYNYANNHYKNSAEMQERYKFLMLLLLPNTQFRNVQSALDMLENLPEMIEPSSNLAAFRDILLALLKEQQSATDRQQQLAAKLRATEIQVKALQEKIDVIKDLEKNLMRRNAL